MGKRVNFVAAQALRQLDRATSYQLLCDAFSELTASKVNSQSGMCCSDVRQGVPKCCYTLLDETCYLTLTAEELKVWQMLAVDWIDEGVSPVHNPLTGTYTLERINGTKMERSLHVGNLAHTLECVSHPTRPVIKDGIVTGVVTVKDCIAEEYLPYMRHHGHDFLFLWQMSVELFGVKPYYITGPMTPGKFETVI